MMLSEDLLVEATVAYDAVIAAGGTPAQGLGAAAATTDEPINDVFNSMLDADVLRFVATDRRHIDKKNGEGRPLVRVKDPNGKRVVDGWLVT